jgi:lysophospholipase L1-like esterase
MQASERLHPLLSVLTLLMLLLTGCIHQSAPSAAAPANAAVPVPHSPATSTPSPGHDLATNEPSRVTPINSNLPTIFIAGDSTAARGAGDAQQGWAVPFADYFDLRKVNIFNRARGGRSSRTFITEGLWDRLVADLKKGDIVLLQFGHNDAGPINDTARARGSLPGLGDETEEVDNLLTKQHEVVHTFGWYMRKMIADVKARGATPIVLSLTVRDIWKQGKVERGSGQYSRWAAELAKSAHVQFINVTDLVADKFDAMGEEKVKAMYPRDHTHFNQAGADVHARAVVAGLKELRPGPVQHFLSVKGEAVEYDRFGWLNLPGPADPALPSLFLIGDSTVRNGRADGAGGQWGWGDYLGEYFDPKKINVVNRAVGGLSSRTYLTQGHWERVVAMLKPRDFIMMQFGHNDNGSPTNPPPGRSSIKGIGDETQEVINPTNGVPETVHTFGWYLRKYIADTRAKGATPIVCSLVPRKIWRDGKIVRNKDSHAGWAQQVAGAEGVAFVDLNEIIAQRYDELGPEKVNALFADEHTHTSKSGAELNAQCVVAGLQMLKTNPLARYLRPALDEVKPLEPLTGH